MTENTDPSQVTSPKASAKSTPPPLSNPVINEEKEPAKAKDNPAVADDLGDAYGNSAATREDGQSLNDEHSSTGRGPVKAYGYDD